MFLYLHAQTRSRLNAVASIEQRLPNAVREVSDAISLAHSHHYLQSGVSETLALMKKVGYNKMLCMFKA
jgi:S-adenosylmethionine/arginine decarboxylase-like enzyme